MAPPFVPSPRVSVTSATRPRRSHSATSHLSLPRNGSRGRLSASTAERTRSNTPQVAQTRSQLKPWRARSSRSRRTNASGAPKGAEVAHPEQERRLAAEREAGAPNAEHRGSGHIPARDVRRRPFRGRLHNRRTGPAEEFLVFPSAATARLAGYDEVQTRHEGDQLAP